MCTPAEFSYVWKRPFCKDSLPFGFAEQMKVSSLVLCSGLRDLRNKMASKFNSTQIMVIARIWKLWILRTTNNSHMIAVEKNYEIITSTLPIPQPVLEKQLEPSLPEYGFPVWGRETVNSLWCSLLGPVRDEALLPLQLAWTTQGNLIQMNPGLVPEAHTNTDLK